MSASSSALAEIRPPGPPSSGEMAAILAAAVREHTGPPMKIRRHESDDGVAFWRWDCTQCGEYGGGRHHPDAINRATRHCGEHPGHRSSLLPPLRCRQREAASTAPMPPPPV